MCSDPPVQSGFAARINSLAGRGIPFFFLVDFELKKPLVFTLEEAAARGLFYDFRGRTNAGSAERQAGKEIRMEMLPVSRDCYDPAFRLVQDHLRHGNTYLLNLTFPTALSTEMDLEDIFIASSAPYRLLYRDNFVLFSPECFVRIEGNRIFSFPMKGTIDASVRDAESVILGNLKESREHNTIVDLIRNDLSMVSERVRVARFRYTERIRTHRNELVQVSSEIVGELGSGWRGRLGDILLRLLPAGSVSGAPKGKTVEIIRQAEQADRGYFTGISGIFDGRELDSAVNIRFIEKTPAGLRFRSGGGITCDSNAADEYNELISKVYVPLV